MPAPKFFASHEAFHKWQSANSTAARELLVGFYKAGSDRPSMSWSESVDEALCFGWIGGVRRHLDDESYSIRLTPRQLWQAAQIFKELFQERATDGRPCRHLAALQAPATLRRTDAADRPQQHQGAGAMTAPMTTCLDTLARPLRARPCRHGQW